MPATPTNTTFTPSSNLGASPASLVGQVIFAAAWMEFPKSKQRARLVASMREAVAALESRAGVLGIREREPAAQAQARADAAFTLRALIADREAL